MKHKCECENCQRKRAEGREYYRKKREEYLRNGGTDRRRGRPRQSDEERKRKKREQVAACWKNDPAFRERQNEYQRSLRAAEGRSRADHLARVAANKLSDEELARRRRNRQSDRLKNDPEYRERHRRYRRESARRIRGSVPLEEYRAAFESKRIAREEAKAARRVAQEARKAELEATAVARELKRKELQKQWREANRERHRELQRSWKKANRAKVNARRIRKRKTIIAALFPKQRGRCAYCRGKLVEDRLHIDHIMPKALGGSNARSNLQLTCDTCNMSKKALHPVEFAQSLGRLV